MSPQWVPLELFHSMETPVVCKCGLALSNSNEWSDHVDQLRRWQPDVNEVFRAHVPGQLVAIN